jgi:hypothetical protein
MSGTLAAAGTAAVAALCCLAIPLTAGIIGISGLAALGINLGVAATIVSALIFAWIVRTRSRDEAEAFGDED